MDPNLTPAEIAQIRADLIDARRAYHRLMIGEGVVQTRDQNGETIAYTAAKAPELAGYIASLESKLGIGRNRARRPAGVYFGR